MESLGRFINWAIENPDYIILTFIIIIFVIRILLKIVGYVVDHTAKKSDDAFYAKYLFPLSSSIESLLLMCLGQINVETLNSKAKKVLIIITKVVGKKNDSN